MFRQILLSAVLVTAWLIASAGMASAEPFAMSSVLSNFCCTDWTGKDLDPPARVVRRPRPWKLQVQDEDLLQRLQSTAVMGVERNRATTGTAQRS